MKSSAAGRWYVLAGVVAGLAGIAVSHAATVLLNARATPLLAVGEAVIEITPGSIAEGLISIVGRNDKPLLVLGVSLVLLSLAAWASAISRHSRLLANIVFLLMGVIAGAAVLSRPASSPVDLLPVVLGTATWILVLAFLADYLSRHIEPRSASTSPTGMPATRPAGTTAVGPAGTKATGPAATATAGPAATTAASQQTNHQANEHSDLGRRGFLIRAGAVAAAAVVVGIGGEFFGRARRGVEATRALLRLPTSAGRVPVGANLGVDGIAPWRSPTDNFYRIDTALVVPAIDPNQWQLRIHGMVENEIVLTYRELLERKMTEDWVTICCVSNEVGGDLIGNAWWSGVRVADLLAEAGVSPDANAVLQTSEDGWTCGTPLAALTDDRNALLAIAMNGDPLPVEHGFPVRTIVPGLYGYVSATKWVVDFEVTRFDDFSAYWTERGWSAQGPVKTQSRIDVPRDSYQVSVGTIAIGGSAWAQHTGIEKVEFRLDGNDWQEATLGKVPGADTWAQWSGEVDVQQGRHSLAVRATDTSGYTQTGAEAGVLPNGATGWHTVDFNAE